MSTRRSLDYLPGDVYSYSTRPEDASSRLVSVSDFFIHPSGSGIQIINTEPLGYPRISLYQNRNIPSGSTIGSLDTNVGSSLASSITTFSDGVWGSRSSESPSGMRIMLSQQSGGISERFNIGSDGRTILGSQGHPIRSNLISVDIQRPGVLHLPRVPSISNLRDINGICPDGCIVYVTDLERFVVSQGGTWRGIVTESLS